MKSARRACLLLVTALVFSASGCRTAGLGTLTRVDAPPVKTTASAADLLSEHNQNAALVQSLEANTTVSGKNRIRLLPGASGKLALERPRNFRLIISSPIADVADIGSNDDEFWFWFKDSDDKAVYFCNYDDQGVSPLAAGLQPEWIIEAMGLREIPATESDKMQVKPGKDPDTVLLSLTRKMPQGQGIIKEIVLSEKTHFIREQRVYSADHKTLLARAQIVSDYDKYTLKSPETGEETTVSLPRKLKLELNRDEITLNVSMSDVKLNKLNPDRRTALFVEPRKNGFARVNLAERTGMARASTSEVRETMPAPPPRVRLSEPAPVADPEARRTQLRTVPAEVAAALPPAYARGVEEVVGPRIPTVIEPTPATLGNRTGWRMSLER